MDINLKRFVNINLQYHEQSSSINNRDTIALLTNEGDSKLNSIFDSYKAIKEDETFGKLENVLKYAEIFFNNEGIKLHIYTGISSNEDITSLIKETIPNSEIVICYCGDYSEIKEAAKTQTKNLSENTSDITKIYGINTKLFLGRTKTSEDCSSIDYFGVKVSNVVGAEMTIAAYLSQLDVYGNNTIQDYCFTQETLTQESNDDEVLESVLQNNMNVDMELAEKVRNIGGNLTNRHDLVNDYVLIILQQTVTEKVLSLLTTKIKGSLGVSSIYTTISSELTNYITNGYLSTDKSWTDETKKVVYNSKTYTLIEKNTQLPLGYKVVVLPISSLSAEDVKNRNCPPIYIFIADSYGIRSVTINGEII